MFHRAAVWTLCFAFSVLAPAAQPEVNGDPASPVAGQVMGTPIRTSDADELRTLVLTRLTEAYARQHGITVSQAEKKAFNRYLQNTMRQERARTAKRRTELQRALARKGLSDAERKTLAKELESVNSLLQSAFAARTENAGTAEEAQARDQIAAAFISQWKINRALYAQYGGRIIFQQGGPEPLDAHRRFLEERQAKGDFSIADKALETAFWRYYRDDSIHDFYARGSKEEKRAFASAPWLMKH